VLSPNCILIARKYAITPPPPKIPLYNNVGNSNPLSFNRVVRLTSDGMNSYNVLFQNGGGKVIIDKLIVDSTGGGYCYFNVKSGQTWGGINYVYINDISFIGDSSLILGGEFSGSGYASISILVRNDEETILERLRHISSGGNKVRAFLDGTHPGYYRIIKGYEPWTPTPEPSTYGAAFSFAVLGVGFIRKRKKRKLRSAALNPSSTPM